MVLCLPALLGVVSSFGRKARGVGGSVLFGFSGGDFRFDDGEVKEGDGCSVIAVFIFCGVGRRGDFGGMGIVGEPVMLVLIFSGEGGGAARVVVFDGKEKGVVAAAAE